MLYRSLILFSVLLALCSFPPLSVGDEQTKEGDDVALEIKTVEVMVNQLEMMPRPSIST